MTLPDDRLALLADARLTGDARIMCWYLIELGDGPEGDGWNEVPHGDFRRLLRDGPSDDTLRRHVRALEAASWIEQDSNTGRRPPRYRVLPKEESGPFRDALAASLPLTGAGQTSVDNSLPRTGQGETNLSPAPDRGKRPSAPHRTGADVRVVEVEVGVGEEGDGEVGAREPRRWEVSAMAVTAIEEHGELFQGCRGALRDYLALRVPDASRQVGYVQSIAGWLNGIDPAVFRLPSGEQVPPDRRTGIVANALNDLLGSDEGTFRRPIGEVSNLRSKIRWLLGSWRPPADQDPVEGAPAEELRDLLEGIPEPAVEAFASLQHPEGSVQSAATLREAFLYPDGAEPELADASLQGKALRRRREIVGRALLEYRDQKRAWNGRAFSAFVARIVSAPRAGTEQQAVRRQGEPNDAARRSLAAHQPYREDEGFTPVKADVRKLLESAGVRPPTAPDSESEGTE